MLYGSDALTRSRLIPVIVLNDSARAVPLAKALLAGGLPVAEITFRSAAAPDAIRAICDAGLTEGDDPILVGAGTVLSAKQVDIAVSAGAQFIVSPGLSRAVVERCRDHGVTVLPGAVTATEVQAALDLGLDLVKFFPSASSGGVAAVKALSGPFADMRFIPSGGVGPEDLDRYLSLPCVAAVGGSWMVPQDLIEGGAMEQVQELVLDAVARVASVSRAAV